MIAQAADIALAWDANPEPDIAGYRVHYGTAFGIHTQSVEVASNAATISNLSEGIAYFFAVTAFNSAGLDSAASNEVFAVAPRSSGTVPPPAPQPRSLVNVSTRGGVQTGDNVMIGGFIITGDTPKKVVLRGVGPSLAAFGVVGAIADPKMDLYDSSGAVIASNNDWTSDQSQELAVIGLAPRDVREAALVATLPAGLYTMVMRGQNSASGIALFELYDLDPASSRIANISTRGKIETGDGVLIGGFIIGGAETTKVIIRALGPSLTQYGIANALADPVTELHNENGALIFQNDNWRSDQEQQIVDSNLQPSDDRESAIIATLPPARYTVIVRGKNNSRGIALFEVYNPEP